jgi:hypothetical protein
VQKIWGAHFRTARRHTGHSIDDRCTGHPFRFVSITVANKRGRTPDNRPVLKVVCGAIALTSSRWHSSQARGTPYVNALQSSFVRAFPNFDGFEPCFIMKGVPAGFVLAVGDVETNIRTSKFEVVHPHQPLIVIITAVEAAGWELVNIAFQVRDQFTVETLPS